MGRRSGIPVVVLLSAIAGVAVWAVLRFTAPNLLHSISATDIPPVANRSTAEMWEQAVAKVKEDRGEIAGTVPIEIPPELRHYEERRWFLGTQVAEVHKHHLAPYQDFVDLAAKLQSGELVGVLAVTDTYILFGVGQIANDGPFSRYENDQNVELLNQQGFNDELARIDATQSTLKTEIADLTKQANLNRRDRTRRDELQKQIAARQEELRSNDQYKKRITDLFAQSENRDRLSREYESLQTFAKDFRGRSFDLNIPADRHTLKVTLLSSLRPPALKVMEEIAASYHRQFNRPLPVSSLVRPEQYQRALRRVNRSAANIETPPHSTGLAFDIDYRYMSAAEQNFLMAELARLKQAGRIEALRERSANYHVFVFLDGTKPSDELITAALDEVGPAPPETNAVKGPARAKSAKSSRKSRKNVRPKAAPKRRRR
jgi:hypothetical protein